VATVAVVATVAASASILSFSSGSSPFRVTEQLSIPHVPSLCPGHCPAGLPTNYPTVTNGLPLPSTASSCRNCYLISSPSTLYRANVVPVSQVAERLPYALDCRACHAGVAFATFRFRGVRCPTR
jgi:hypothetical protein